MRISLINTPRQKIITTISLTVIIASSVLALIAWPSIKTIKELSEQIYQQRIELEALYQRGQVLKQTLREYEEIKPSIPLLNRIYLSRGQELDFIITLEETAAESNVGHNIKLTASDPKKPTNQLQYQLQTEGNLTNFIRYLASLESLDFYVNINTIRLSTTSLPNQRTNQNLATDDVLQAILLATSYFKP